MTATKAQIGPITGGVFHGCKGYTTTLYDTTPGGYFMSTNAARISVDSFTGVVHFNISGTTAAIRYYVGSSYATKTLTCDPSPADIGNNVGVCVGSSSFLTDGTSGGTWTSTNTAIATMGTASYSSPMPYNGVSVGLDTIIYTRSNGCAVFATVTVNALPDLSNLSLAGSNVNWVDIYSTSDEVVTLTSTTLANGTYDILCDMERPDSFVISPIAATIVFSSGTGTFTISHSGFNPSGTHIVTLTSITNHGNGCVTTISAGNTTTFDVLP